MSGTLLSSLPAEGPLRAGLTQHLYGLAATDELTGLLRLNLKDYVLSIHFRKGNPELVDTTSPADSLATFLTQRKLVTEEQLASAGAQKMRFGDDVLGALFGLGFLNPNAVFPLLGQRARSLLTQGFLAEEGDFHFEAVDFPAQRALPLGHRWAVYFEVLRQVPMPEVTRRMSAAMDFPVMKGAGRLSLADLKLTPQETRALHALNGVRTLRALMADFPRDAETTLRLAWMLLPLNMVSFAQVRPPEKTPPTTQRPATPAVSPPVSSPSRVSAAPASPVAPPSAPVDFSAEVKTLQALLPQMQSQNYFEVLGVPKEADAAAVKVAYLKAARTYHPDTVPAGAPAALMKLKADIFALVGEAQRTLSDVALRQQYLVNLEAGGKGTQVDVEALLKGEELFRKGRLFIQSRKYVEAVRFFEEAVANNADEGEFYAWRGWARFLAAEDKKKVQPEALRDLNLCLAKNPNVAAAFYFLGFIAKSNGDRSAALSNFKKCVAIDPKHIDAQREIRLMSK